MDAARVVATSVRSHWQSTGAALDKFREHGDGSGVHDLRVGLRRLMAALDLASALDAGASRRVQRELKTLLSALSPLRDLQVQERTLERLGPTEPRLAEVARELSRRRKRAARSLVQVASKFPAARCGQALVRCAEKLEKESSTPSAARLLTLAAVARRYAKFDRRRRAVADTDRHALHRVRVAFKRYRYAVEIASPLLSKPAQDMVEAMKRFQGELGAIQDASVLIETLARARLPKRNRLPVLEGLERERAQLIERARAALKAQVSSAPPAFSEPFETAGEAAALAAPASAVKASKRRKTRSRAR
jgi:CHAD domain-containing protein